MGETAELTPLPADTSPAEMAIDQVLRDTVFRMTPQLLVSWIYDIARKMLPPEIIAERYGFATVQAMVDVISANEALRERIKQERAVWFSEENLENRLRYQHQLILYETAHENGKPLFDPSTGIGQRVDLMNAIASIGGVRGPNMAHRGGAGGTEGPTRWTIQMVFPNAGKVEEISLKPMPVPPTIEGEIS